MNCEAAQAELKAYQDGELDRLGAWRVRRHLGRCAPCARELRMIRKLNALLSLIMWAVPALLLEWKRENVSMPAVQLALPAVLLSKNSA